MNLRLDQPGGAPLSSPVGFPTASELAALRAWYQGLDTREAVARYLDTGLTTVSSARSVIRNIRNQLRDFARLRLRSDLADLIGHKESERTRLARSVFQAIETLRLSPPAMPQISDPIERWLAPQAVKALHAFGIRTLTDLTVRVARRKMWWASIPGLGRTGARQIEAFFALHAALTARARDLVVLPSRQEVVPWEIFTPPWKSTARKVHSEAQNILAHSTPITTTRQFKHGCHCMNLRQLYELTAKKLSDSFSGQCWSEDGLCRP